MRRTTRLLLPLLLAALLVTPLRAPQARADGGGGEIELRDLLAQVPGIVRALLDGRAGMLRCPVLIGGTIGLPEAAGEPGRRGTDTGNPLREGDPTDAPASLPAQVVFRSTTQT